MGGGWNGGCRIGPPGPCRPASGGSGIGERAEYQSVKCPRPKEGFPQSRHSAGGGSLDIERVRVERSSQTTGRQIRARLLYM
jgi:hypothetical protein